MAITRTTTYNVGGYDTSKPHNNLHSVSYFDDQTQETMVYEPPNIPDPLPPTTAEQTGPEVDPMDALRARVAHLEQAINAGGAGKKGH